MKKSSFQVYDYADDIVIVNKSSFLTIFKERMDEVLISCKLMLNKGTDSKSGKDFMVFTRKVKSELIKPLRHWGKKIN